jgi:hypothetical protein
MATRKHNLGRLGERAPSADPPVREATHAQRLTAFAAIATALEPFNRQERTNLISAVAEFFSLTLTVENG